MLHLITEGFQHWTWIMPWVVYKYGCPYKWVHVGSGHPSHVPLHSSWTEIIPFHPGSRGHWMVGWSDEKSKERKDGIWRSAPAEPGYIDQMGRTRSNWRHSKETKYRVKVRQKKKKQKGISKGRDRKTHLVTETEKETKKEIKMRNVQLFKSRWLPLRRARGRAVEKKNKKTGTIWMEWIQMEVRGWRNVCGDRWVAQWEEVSEEREIRMMVYSWQPVTVSKVSPVTVLACCHTLVACPERTHTHKHTYRVHYGHE